MNDLLTIITPKLESPTLGLAPEATAERDRLLAIAVKAVKPIDSAENCLRKEAVLADMQSFQRKIEALRKEAKDPALQIGKRIDAMARELTDPLDEHITRLKHACGAFRAEEARKAEEARRAREEEVRKAQEEVMRKAKAEQERIEAERRAADEKAAAAKNELERAKAEAERQRLADEQAKALRAAEAQAKAAADAIVPVAAPAKRTGTQLKRSVEFTVTDVLALAKAHPELVEIKPRDGEIRKALLADEKIVIAGVSARFYDDLTTRR